MFCLMSDISALKEIKFTDIFCGKRALKEFKMEQKNQSVWVNIQDTRPVEMDITGIKNVNSLISILKTRFQLITPEHLLLLTRAGMEIPSDIEVRNLSSSFNEPLVLVAISAFDPQQLSKPLFVPNIQRQEEALIAFEEQFNFFKTPPFLGKGTNNEYCIVPIKTFVLILLFVDIPLTFMYSVNLFTKT